MQKISANISLCHMKFNLDTESSSFRLMQRSKISNAPYQRVQRNTLRVMIWHFIFRLRIKSDKKFRAIFATKSLTRRNRFKFTAENIIENVSLDQTPMNQVIDLMCPSELKVIPRMNIYQIKQGRNHYRQLKEQKKIKTVQDKS